MAATASDFQDRRFLKHVRDNLHGIVYLEPVIYQPRFHRFLTSFCVFGITCDEIASCYEFMRSSKKSIISELKLFFSSKSRGSIDCGETLQSTASFSFLPFDLVHIPRNAFFF